MTPARKDYAVAWGYDFVRLFEWPDISPAGFEFRFTVYAGTDGQADIIATVGAGIKFDGSLPEWTVTISTDAMETGEYSYSHDYMAPGGGWQQISVGSFNVVDPRALP